MLEKETSDGGASKPKTEKLPGPKHLPQAVGNYLIAELKQNPNWVWKLKSVLRPRQEGKGVFDFRVFSPALAAEKEVKVKDYTSFDEYPDLILCKGWFNKRTNQQQITWSATFWV